MQEFFSSGQDITRNRYNRLMMVACLDTLFNVPVLVTIVVTQISKGSDSSLNYPYISWKNVHEGVGGQLPGYSLSSILQTPASLWSMDKWDVFNVKWDEWVYVLHAVIFFGVFGTTPEMQHFYQSVLFFIPKRCGYKKHCVPKQSSGAISEIAFDSDTDRPDVEQFDGRRCAHQYNYSDFV